MLAVVLYIMAVGLYELFIDDNLDLPAWLVIHNLEDLKEKLVGVVIVVLAVFFLGRVIESEKRARGAVPRRRYLGGDRCPELLLEPGAGGAQEAGVAR